MTYDSAIKSNIRQGLQADAPEPLGSAHAAAEATGLPPSIADLVMADISQLRAERSSDDAMCCCAEAATGDKEPLTFVHAAAEATGLPPGSADLVTACLVCHELPATATRGFLDEALRLLRPGGAVSIMVQPRRPDLSVMQSELRTCPWVKRLQGEKCFVSCLYCSKPHRLPNLHTK